MPKGIVISATSSKAGKTLITLAILRRLSQRDSLRPFKIGPDYIDPQFHYKITGQNSVNLDRFMMDEQELKSIFKHYTEGGLTAVVEGVMGYFDGMEKESSSYDIARILGIPTLLVISAEGTYTTIAAIVKGLLTYRTDHTIKAVLFNHVSSESHYKMIHSVIRKEFPHIKVLGWIQKDLEHLPSRHLGLDLSIMDDMDVDTLVDKVLTHIDIEGLYEIMDMEEVSSASLKESFTSLSDKAYRDFKNTKITVIQDHGFSFLYYDNIQYLKELFKEVYTVSALENQVIPQDSQVLYIPGGYVETPEIHDRLSQSHRFKSSLHSFASDKGKKVYGECAGLIYLGKNLLNDGQSMEMSGVLPISFRMRPTRKRLGYYEAKDSLFETCYKGHSFHYSEVLDNHNTQAIWSLYKPNSTKAEVGAWTNGVNVLGTYLHSFFRNNPKLMVNYFLPSDSA
ncbi:MAG: cobyrinate a,c-diamide synthase [bacterium]|nr:MAG: cobyrinate a,c-diamide synthase [bacterium]